MSPSDDGEQITTSGPHDDSHDQASQAGRDGFTAGGDQHIYIGGKPAKNRKPATDKDPRRGRLRPWLAVGIAGAVLLGAIAYLLVPGSGTSTSLPSLTTVQMFGKDVLFDDPAVKKALQQQGLVVQQNSPSPEVTCTDKSVIADFDISDSSKEASSCNTQRAQKGGKIPDEYDPYGGLMVIMTYKPVVALLEQLHIASEVNGVTVFDMKKYLEVFASHTRWTEIPGNTTYKNHNRILLWTTDPKQSNLGAILADIAYSAQTGGDTPTSIGPGDKRVPVIRDLFTSLGELPYNSVPLLNEFLARGMGEYPMAMVYEGQYLNAVLTGQATDPNLTVMYPTPDVYTEDTLVAWTPAGEKLIDALKSQPMLNLEEAEGYRTVTDKAGFVKQMHDKGITVPGLDDLENTLQFTNLPTEEILNDLIKAVATNQPG
jgi:hypothetical protein